MATADQKAEIEPRGQQVWVDLAAAESREFRFAIKGKNRFGSDFLPVQPSTVVERTRSPWELPFELSPEASKRIITVGMNSREFRKAVAEKPKNI